MYMYMHMYCIPFAGHPFLVSCIYRGTWQHKLNWGFTVVPIRKSISIWNSCHVVLLDQSIDLWLICRPWDLFSVFICSTTRVINMESCLMPWCSSSASKLTSNIIMTAMLVIIVMANVSRLRIARNQETTYSTTQTLQDSLSRPSHDLESKMCNAGYNQYKDKRQDNYLNRQYLSLEKGQYRIRFDRKNTNLTDDDVKNQDNQHGSCPLKIFTMKDVVKCFDYLAMRRNQRPMHITFMGDSTIRQQFLSFLNVRSFNIIQLEHFTLYNYGTSIDSKVCSRLWQEHHKKFNQVRRILLPRGSQHDERCNERPSYIVQLAQSYEKWLDFWFSTLGFLWR